MLIVVQNGVGMAGWGYKRKRMDFHEKNPKKN